MEDREVVRWKTDRWRRGADVRVKKAWLELSFRGCAGPKQWVAVAQWLGNGEIGLGMNAIGIVGIGRSRATFAGYETRMTFD